MKLTGIRDLGRFRDSRNGKEYNVKTGRNVNRSTDHLFYLYRGTRIYITDADFYHFFSKV